MDLPIDLQEREGQPWVLCGRGHASGTREPRVLSSRALVSASHLAPGLTHTCPGAPGGHKGSSRLRCHTQVPQSGRWLSGEEGNGSRAQLPSGSSEPVMWACTHVSSKLRLPWLN